MTSTRLSSDAITTCQPCVILFYSIRNSFDQIEPSRSAMERSGVRFCNYYFARHGDPGSRDPVLDLTHFLNSQKKDVQGIPPLKKRNGSGLAESDFEKAGEFNGQFTDRGVGEKLS